MPPSNRRTRPAMFNTPQIRTGGFGALQVEAITNRPLSIARRHLAASQLRMRDIEPDELSSSEWVRFLVMEERERDRWMSDFARRRRNSAESASSGDEASTSKAEEARREASRAPRDPRPLPRPRVSAAREQQERQQSAVTTSSSSVPDGATPAVSLWVRQFDGQQSPYGQRPTMHTRRAATGDAPPTYDSVVRPRTPPPAYEPRSDDEGTSPRSPQYEP